MQVSPNRGRGNKISHNWHVHDDVIKWKHCLRNWTLVRGIHRSPVNYLTKASDVELWCFYLICAWTNGWVNSRDVGNLRRHCAHYDVTVMVKDTIVPITTHLGRLICHYLNEWWLIVNGTLWNKFQWNLNKNQSFFTLENKFENVICEMVAILCRHRFVNSNIFTTVSSSGF